MFTRKQQQRLRRLLAVSSLALVLNLVVPAIVQAQGIDSVDAADIVVNHQPGSVASAPIVQPTGPLTTLPEPQDKPVVVDSVLTVRASAYSSTVDQCDGDPFTSASGKKVHDGMIAMNGVAFGTKIRIPSHYGNKVFTVSDRMNARWGSTRIDIWMVSRAAAMQWGVRTVTIEILS